MNTCTEVREYIDLHYFFTYIVLRYWMTCGFLYCCCVMQPPHRRFETKSAEICLALQFFICFDHWTVVGCQSCSFSLVMPSEEVNFHPSHSEIVVLASGQKRVKLYMHIRNGPSSDCGQCSLPGVCIPTDLAESWFDPHLIMNSECVWFSLYPVLQCHLDGVATCPN